MRPLVEMENSGLVALLQLDQNDDLQRMHTLFRRVPGGHDLIRTLMGDLLRKTGRQLVEDPERNKDPVDFVQRLLAEKDKFDRWAEPCLPGLHVPHSRAKLVPRTASTGLSCKLPAEAWICDGGNDYVS